jgi:hypothetical protein
VGNPAEFETELRRRLVLFTPDQRRALLRLLTADESARAEAVARIWASGSAIGLSELLADLQRDGFARTLVVGALYEMDRESEAMD